MEQIKRLDPFTYLLPLWSLLISLVVLPIYGGTFFDGSVKCVLLAIVISIFSITLAFKKTVFSIDYLDLIWWGFIGYTGLSIFWAINENQAISGLFTTILLYGHFKLFSTIQWGSKFSNYFKYTIIFILIWTLVIQGYQFRNTLFNPSRLGRIDKTFLSTLGNVNTHWLGCLFFILLPFLLFQKNRLIEILGVFLFILSLYLTNLSGSAFILLIGMALVGCYTIAKLKLPTKKTFFAFFIFTLFLLFLFGLTYFQFIKIGGLVSILTEFTSQNDRLWMWENSWYLFQESPLIGVGKNNWAVAVGDLGFNECHHCSRGFYFSFQRFVHAHNAFFQLLSEQGIIGLFFYLCIGGIPLFHLLKKWKSISFLELAALLSLGILIALCMMYGIVYNHYGHFAGFPIVGVLCLAILHPKDITPLKISNWASKGLFFVFTLTSLMYFLQFQLAELKFNWATQNVQNAYKLEQAELFYLDGLRYLNPADSYKALANLYQISGNPKTRIIALEKAIQNDPNDVLLHYNLGEQLFELGKYELALNEAEFVDKKAKKYLYNQLLLAKCYKETGATESFSKIINELKTTLFNLTQRENNRFYPNSETQKKLTYFNTEIELLLK